MLLCLCVTRCHPEGCVGESVLRYPAKGVTGWTCVCVCGGDPGTEVLWVLNPYRTTTQFAMKSKHFVSCLFVMKVKTSWLSAGMISHKFNYQFDYLHKYLFHEKGRVLVTGVYGDKFSQLRILRIS
jgi:hypothetical protein